MYSNCIHGLIMENIPKYAGKDNEITAKFSAKMPRPNRAGAKIPGPRMEGAKIYIPTWQTSK